jgi:hypothetical protein
MILQVREKADLHHEVIHDLTLVQQRMKMGPHPNPLPEGEGITQYTKRAV